MFWWKVTELRNALALGTLTERTRFTYLFIFVMLSGVVAEFPATDQQNTWDHVSSVGGLIVGAVGTIWVYLQNGGNAGHHFLERYLSLGWVVFLRYMAIALPLFFVAGAVAVELDFANEATGPFDTTVLLLFLLIYFYGVGRHIRLVTIEESAAQQGAPADRPRPAAEQRR